MDPTTTIEETLEPQSQQETPPAPLFTSKEHQVLEYFEHLSWLKQQRREYEYIIERQTQQEQQKADEPSHSNPISSPSTDKNQEEKQKAEEERLKQRINQLKRELAQVSSADLFKDKAVESAEAGVVILETLFPQRSSASNNSSNNLQPSSNTLNELILERDRLVTEFLKMHHELLEAQFELSKHEKKVIARHIENRKLMSEINRITESNSVSIENGSNPENSEFLETIQRIRKDLENILGKREIVRNVLQGLILESRVEWTEDDHLMTIMLSIGEEF
ncbi:12465_t:CDS:2 [Ambispora gerdemannii]|uniref:12465_t:CDS:1 n=1 Tax=Ambispora gerdemannii TaxID=144530 RepID=A0A9N8Z694_9GLOM|nr:12465_t:CDS:2 [Ambispora gerdemannii]